MYVTKKQNSSMGVLYVLGRKWEQPEESPPENGNKTILDYQ